ncbi:hypothetical protein PFISCL1PPCAC_7468 [Pristionchus fissidentatus]|uniref:Uncharacterized protein n=1 Tax=Pristionchus fissidentatus TaxID=1538716 RepID=A0AAV5V973_9BILA|nr:hypothetical protein PFISCL1PPCAC_7468 [Pristionchus fissidentatus]
MLAALVLSLCATVAVASIYRESPAFDFESALEAQLALEEAELNGASDASSYAPSLRALIARSRGRREEDAPFRMCGAKLLEHIMVQDMCNCAAGRKKRSVDDSESSAASTIFSSRARRAADKKISNLCCINMCRPSEVRKACCE